ncbi:hypothetical protein SAMN05660461_5317 [Chitinophaga ginsengisegetis]|uniref:Uncharacterized protein n=1 Tax=Chitinophaga ginsengisegetis TaxID=393003 RepID=A0A1T5PAZ2_9BACT|nr:hypothetical protein [Chitinophaga ginsengisegetis]SKD09429.1 hypothetical protein SAMN05660461_5317 [Chitinophaga ginsengisegetis]
MPNSQGLIPKRMVIYARDIENITGRSERTARLMLQRIRETFGKNQGQFISVSEFCQYTGLKEEEVNRFLLY